MHHRLGAAGWERVSQRELDRLGATEPPSANEFRYVDGQWRLRFADRTVRLPDAKGLRDLAVLIAAQGSDVHVRDLLNPTAVRPRPGIGADPVLDLQAKAHYRARLVALAGQIEEAGSLGRTAQACRLADERAVLIRELAAANGFGGRDRRLGDETERAWKTVGARIRDSLRRIDTVHPELATHLRAAVRMGTTCVYRPATATSWQLGVGSDAGVPGTGLTHPPRAAPGQVRAGAETAGRAGQRDYPT
jgi:hypothetical protein